jgi:hypothetical protein
MVVNGFLAQIGEGAPSEGNARRITTHELHTKCRVTMSKQDHKKSNGWGGRRPGAGRPKLRPGKADRSLLEPAKLAAFVGREAPPTAPQDIVRFAREQIVKVAAGEFGVRRGPTILRASIALLDEALGRMVEKQELRGTLDIAAIVARANEKAPAVASRVVDVTPPQLPAAPKPAPLPDPVPLAPLRSVGERASDYEPDAFGPVARRRSQPAFCITEEACGSARCETEDDA